MKTDEVNLISVFNEAINAGDIETLSSLMTEDHTFIDSNGNKVSGLEKVKEGWVLFFQMFPDYQNTIEGIFQDGDSLMAYGMSSGTYQGNPEGHFEMPAAWKATLEDGKLKEWRVYADWSQFHKILENVQRNRHRSGPS